jgi:hypothetical protein
VEEANDSPMALATLLIPPNIFQFVPFALERRQFWG